MNNGIFNFPTSFAQSSYSLLGRPSSVPMVDYKTSIFDPRDFQGLQMWLDASDSTTIFDKIDGGSLPNDKSAVALWRDKSLKNNAFIQNTANNRPIRKHQQLNGLDGIYFNGNNFLYCNLNVFDTAVSVLVVADFDNNSSRRAVLDLNTQLSVNYRHFVIEQNTFQTAGNRYGFYASNNALDSDFVTSSGAKLFCLTANTIAASSIISNTSYRINGTSRTLTVKAGGGSYSDYTTSNGVGIGDFNNNGVGGGYGGIGLLGHIYEVIVYNVILSSNQISIIENYLARKWGLSI